MSPRLTHGQVSDLLVFLGDFAAWTRRGKGGRGRPLVLEFSIYPTGRIP
jgi:hypothetical protein